MCMCAPTLNVENMWSGRSVVWFHFEGNECTEISDSVLSWLSDRETCVRLPHLLFCMQSQSHVQRVKAWRGPCV